MIPYLLSDDTHITITRTEADWLETCLMLGAFFGLPLTAFLTDKFGRRQALIFSCCILVITWTVIAVTSRIEFIYVSRISQGIGLNMAYVAAPMYIGEIAQKEIRGFLSSIVSIMNVLGVVIIYTTGSLMSFQTPSIIAAVILIFEIAIFIFLPESPYYLISKGKLDEVEKSLKKLRCSAEVAEELLEIHNLLEEDNKQDKPFLKEIITVKNYRKAILIATVLNFAQLFCSSEVILMNLHEILSAAGSAYINSTTAGIIFSVINLMASTVSAVFVDKFGRIKLLFTSIIMTSLCLFILAVYFHLKNEGYDTHRLSWLPVMTVLIYGVVYRFGLGVVPMVLTCELFAPKIKSFGLTFGDGIYIISSVSALQLFLYLRNHFGLHIPFYVFFCCTIVISLFVIFYIPETKDKSLDEIQKILKNESLKVTEEQEKMMDLQKKIEVTEEHEKMLDPPK